MSWNHTTIAIAKDDLEDLEQLGIAFLQFAPATLREPLGRGATVRVLIAIVRHHSEKGAWPTEDELREIIRKAAPRGRPPKVQHVPTPPKMPLPFLPDCPDKPRTIEGLTPP